MKSGAGWAAVVSACAAYSETQANAGFFIVPAFKKCRKQASQRLRFRFGEAIVCFVFGGFGPQASVGMTSGCVIESSFGWESPVLAGCEE